MDQQQLPEESLARPSRPVHGTGRGDGHPLPPTTRSREDEHHRVLHLKGAGLPGNEGAFPEITASRCKYLAKITVRLGLPSEANPVGTQMAFPGSAGQLASGQPAKPGIVPDGCSRPWCHVPCATRHLLQSCGRGHEGDHTE